MSAMILNYKNCFVFLSWVRSLVSLSLKVVDSLSDDLSSGSFQINFTIFKENFFKV